MTAAETAYAPAHTSWASEQVEKGWTLLSMVRTEGLLLTFWLHHALGFSPVTEMLVSL